MNWIDVRFLLNDAKMLHVLSFSTIPESITIHSVNIRFRYNLFFSLNNSILFTFWMLVHFFQFFQWWRSERKKVEEKRKRIMIPYCTNRYFYSYFLKCERAWTWDVSEWDSDENKQYLLWSHGTDTKKKPHKPKQSISSASGCVRAILILSINHLKCVFFVAVWWVTVSTLYLILICSHIACSCNTYSSSIYPISCFKKREREFTVHSEIKEQQQQHRQQQKKIRKNRKDCFM